MQIRLEKPPDIIALEENTEGEDKIIGDLHGSAETLRSVLAMVGEKDRLFIVGDLTDRGDDSPGVIRAILEFNAANNNRIFCARGNHETLCLNAIERYEAILKSGQANVEELFAADPAIAVHRKNGGEWLHQLFQKGQFDDIKMVKDFMSSLPYIMHVKGEKPFNVVHADMPFNDITLQKRIKENPYLNSNEKIYATWAKTSTW